MKAIYYVIFEILTLFALGGIYFLFQKRKYIRLHEQTTRDFMNQIKEADPNHKIPEDTLAFETDFTNRYKSEKSLDSYSHSEKLHQIYSDYLNYIESISGPLV